MSFLNAEWRKLSIFNYKIDPVLLEPYIPAGTDLDLWEDNCYLSLVGFMFLNTRVLGLRVPYHIDFEEVNLRFYVRRLDESGSKRGVVFIRELVPKPALAFVANALFNENYLSLPMKHIWNEDVKQRSVEYGWKMGDRWHTIIVNADLAPSIIEEGSEAEFITEHYWGYSRVDQRRSNEYEVRHIRWQQFKVRSYEINVDFGLTYGDSFAFLSDLEPSSIMLAEGSAISVEWGKSMDGKN